MFKKIISSIMALAIMASICTTVMAEDASQTQAITREKAAELIAKVEGPSASQIISRAREHNAKEHNGAPVGDIQKIVYITNVTDQNLPIEPKPVNAQREPRYYACPGPTGHEYITYYLDTHLPCNVDNCGKCDVYRTPLYECRYCGDAYSGSPVFSYTHTH